MAVGISTRRKQQMRIVTIERFGRLRPGAKEPSGFIYSGDAYLLRFRIESPGGSGMHETAGGHENRTSPKRDTLFDDFQKLLDRRLPNGAFRISWVVAGTRARATSDSVVKSVGRILGRAARKMDLPAGAVHLDMEPAG